MQELLKQAMMKLERANARAKPANKVALEAEKEKDAAEKAVEDRICKQREHALMMMLVMLMICSQKLIIGT